MMFPDAGFTHLGGLRFRIERQSRLFDGHFDGAPILPGIAHIALALSASQDKTLGGIRDVRFSRSLGPGDEVEVAIRESRFEIRRAGNVASTGVLLPPPQWGAAALGGASAPLRLRRRRPTLPHSRTARLLTNVLASDATSIEAEGEIEPSHPLVTADRAPNFLGIELGAQAAAALQALSQTGERVEPVMGVLTRIREAIFSMPDLPAGTPLRVFAKLDGAAGPLAIYQIRVSAEGMEAVRATISITATTFENKTIDAARG